MRLCVKAARCWQRRKRSGLQTHPRAARPLHYVSPRAVFVGFLAPQSLISRQTTANETRDRYMTRMHKFTREHLRVLTRSRSRNRFTCTHTHTHKEPVLHNKWWHLNCRACLFISACNGWPFPVWQPIREGQKDCKQPCTTQPAS